MVTVITKNSQSPNGASYLFPNFHCSGYLRSKCSDIQWSIKDWSNTGRNIFPASIGESYSWGSQSITYSSCPAMRDPITVHQGKVERPAAAPYMRHLEEPLNFHKTIRLKVGQMHRGIKDVTHSLVHKSGHTEQKKIENYHLKKSAIISKGQLPY